MSEVGNDTYLTEMDIRLWLRDADPSANTLLDDYEYNTEEIRTASMFTVDYWNETPPAVCTHWNVNNFPHRYHLLLGTVGNLLYMAAYRYRRNQLDYNVPGGGISDQNKAQQYEAAGQRLWEQYKQWCATKKKSINVHQGWGSV